MAGPTIFMQCGPKGQPIALQATTVTDEVGTETSVWRHGDLTIRLGEAGGQLTVSIMRADGRGVQTFTVPKPTTTTGDYYVYIPADILSRTGAQPQVFRGVAGADLNRFKAGICAKAAPPATGPLTTAQEKAIAPYLTTLEKQFGKSSAFLATIRGVAAKQADPVAFIQNYFFGVLKADVAAKYGPRRWEAVFASGLKPVTNYGDLVQRLRSQLKEKPFRFSHPTKLPSPEMLARALHKRMEDFPKIQLGILPVTQGGSSLEGVAQFLEEEGIPLGPVAEQCALYRADLPATHAYVFNLLFAQMKKVAGREGGPDWWGRNLSGVTSYQQLVNTLDPEERSDFLKLNPVAARNLLIARIRKGAVPPPPQPPIGPVAPAPGTTPAAERAMAPFLEYLQKDGAPVATIKQVAGRQPDPVLFLKNYTYGRLKQYAIGKTNAAWWQQHFSDVTNYDQLAAKVGVGGNDRAPTAVRAGLDRRIQLTPPTPAPQPVVPAPVPVVPAPAPVVQPQTTFNQRVTYAGASLPTAVLTLSTLEDQMEDLVEVAQRMGRTNPEIAVIAIPAADATPDRVARLRPQIAISLQGATPRSIVSTFGIAGDTQTRFLAILLPQDAANTKAWNSGLIQAAIRDVFRGTPAELVQGDGTVIGGQPDPIPGLPTPAPQPVVPAPAPPAPVVAPTPAPAVPAPAPAPTVKLEFNRKVRYTGGRQPVDFPAVTFNSDNISLIDALTALARADKRSGDFYIIVHPDPNDRMESRRRTTEATIAAAAQVVNSPLAIALKGRPLAILAGSRGSTTELQKRGRSDLFHSYTIALVPRGFPEALDQDHATRFYLDLVKSLFGLDISVIDLDPAAQPTPPPAPDAPAPAPTPTVVPITASEVAARLKKAKFNATSLGTGTVALTLPYDPAKWGESKARLLQTLLTILPSTTRFDGTFQIALENVLPGEEAAIHQQVEQTLAAFKDRINGFKVLWDLGAYWRGLYGKAIGGNVAKIRKRALATDQSVEAEIQKECLRLWKQTIQKNIARTALGKQLLAAPDYMAFGRLLAGREANGQRVGLVNGRFIPEAIALVVQDLASASHR